MDRSHAIRAIKDAVDLVQLVSERVKLRKSGSGWMGGPCPIHGGGSRTPCISVQPDKGQWHCFGCGEGGDAFDWMEKVGGLTFEEAVEDLAKRTGIALPQRGDRQQGPSREDRILAATQAAQAFYVAQLKRHPAAMDYLRGRGLSDAIIEAEGIGYAPDAWDATLNALQRGGTTQEVAEDAGLAGRSSRGTMIDFIRSRITIPIKDARGRVIAFGGRAMPGAPPNTPKYMNTRETAVYRKGDTVFGLHRARAFIREEGATIVEGYFDVLCLWDHGIQTAVAPLGTALTEQHLATLKRWTSRITLLFDGDDAGTRATEKALAMALPMGFDVRLLLLPDGEDPDTWSQKTPDAKARILQAPDWATFRLAKAREGRDFRRIEDRVAAAREVAEWIAYLPPSRRQEVQVAAAHELRVPVEQLQGKLHAPPEAAPQAERRQAPRIQADDAVRALMVQAAKGGPYTTWTASIPRGWWENRPGAAALETLLDADGDVEALGPETQTAIREAIHQEATRAPIDVKRLQLRLEREYLHREIQESTRSLALHAMDGKFAEPLQRRITEHRARLAKLMRGTR